MRINRKEFLKVLNDLFPITGRGDENPSNMYSFICDDKENWYVAVTNNCVAAIMEVPFKFDSQFKVKADLLLPLIKKMKDEEIDVLLSASNVIIRTDTPTEVVLPMGDKGKTMIDFIQSIEDDQFKELPTDFSKLLKKSSEHTFEGTGSTKSILSYVYAQGTTMCSANKSELVMYDLDKPVDKMFIASNDIPLISGFNFMQYAYTDDLLYFKTDGNAFIAVRPASRQERYPVLITEEDFTSIERTNMSNMTPKALFNTEGLRKMVLTDKEASQIISTIHTCFLFSGDNADFSCSFDMNKLTIACSSLKGSYKQNIDITEPVSPVVMKMNPMDFIRAVECKAPIYFGNNRILVFGDAYKQYIQASITYGLV